MGSDTGSGGIISPEQLNQLVSLFDRFEFALDPNSRDAKEAESELENLIGVLHKEACRQGMELALKDFRNHVRKHCRMLINKGLSQPTAPPPSA
jgi:hypothetical protein